LALDGVTKEGLASPQRGRQVEHYKRLADAPLAGE
jgi:hypothetical protein